MKAKSMILLGAVVLFSSVAVNGAEVTDNANAVTQSKPLRYEVAERGANHRVWNKVVIQTNRLGQVTLETQRAYVELTTGLHFEENGQWKESRAEIGILPDGAGAAAQLGRHKVVFPPDVRDGLIELNTPDGKWLRSRVLGLAYLDSASGRSVFIATVTNSLGVLQGSNVVVYPSAFQGVKADMRYTYRKSGFEQDVILREQPPAPEKFGLSPQTTRLQVWTEFNDAPVPVKQAEDVGGLTDERLDFGAMKMGRGRAFTLEDEAGSLVRSRGVPVAKRWMVINGRMFLVEEVPMKAVREKLDALPKADGASLNLRSNQVFQTASSSLQLPVRPAVNKGRKAVMQMAKLEVPARDGFVLDYEIINEECEGTYTLQSNVTYLVSGDLYACSLAFESATVVKFGYDSGTIWGSVAFPTSSYQPAILTSINDNSVGEIIPGSTGNPQVSGTCYLHWLDSAANVRISYAGIGVYYDGACSVWNSQFLNCGTAIYSITGYGYNCLFVNCGSVWRDEGGTDEAFFGYNITADNCGTIFYSDNGEGPRSTFLSNCLITGVDGVTNQITAGSGTVSVTTNETVYLESGSGVYHNLVLGRFYLATNSPYRDIGTTNIDAGLLAALQQMTTYPPPQSYADTNTPDLGFHYPLTTDWDLDGMEDGWEWNWFGNLNQSAGGDYDGDGVSNNAEFIAGTNPTGDNDGDRRADQPFKVRILSPR